jgi:hypothetical protein
MAGYLWNSHLTFYKTQNKSYLLSNLDEMGYKVFEKLLKYNRKHDRF